MSNWRRGAFWAVLLYGLQFPGPILEAQTNLLPILTAYRQHYGTPMSRAEIGELLTLTAQSTPGWALLRKDSGSTCPAMGVRVSCDYLVFTATGQGFDVLRDVEGLAVPVWNIGDFFTPERYVYVVTGPPAPDPGTGVPNVGLELEALKARIAELEAMTQAGFDLVSAELAANKMLLESHTQKLESLQAEHSQMITEPKAKPWWQVVFGWLW